MKPRIRKWAVTAGVGLALYLSAESLCAPEIQPSAKACRALIRVYQATASPLMHACGANCRYRPSCSVYADQAIERHGTLPGIAYAAIRLLRCAPWGGWGDDPVPRG